MNKVIEDIIFLKDNLEKLDSQTYESLYNKENGEEEKEKKRQKKKKTIIKIIWAVVAIGVFIFSMAQRGGLLLSLLNAIFSPGVIVLGLGLSFGILTLAFDIVGDDFGLVGLVFGILIIVAPCVVALTIIKFPITAGLGFAESIPYILIEIACCGIDYLLWTKWLNKKKKIVLLKEEQEDELTKKLYSIKAEYGLSKDLRDCKDIYSDDVRNQNPLSYLESRIELMQEFDSSDKVQYPMTQVPEKSNLNREVLLSRLEDSNLFRDIVLKIGDATLFEVLKQKQDEIYVNNDEREKYLNIVVLLLEKIEKIKFKIELIPDIGIELLHRRGDEYVPYIYSKLRDSITPIIQSDEYTELKKLNVFYKEELKQFNNDLKGTLIGANGEREVLKTLTDFAEISGKDKIRILPNIRLEPNGKSVESDFIVVCPNGVFALEVKNLGSTGSYNITVEKDGLWKKVMKNGRWKQMPDSISRQNERHLMGIEQVINSKMGNSTESWIEAKSLIVFANNVVGIRNYSNNVIIRDSEIMTEIRKHPICLNEQQINQIAEILLAESLPAKKYKMENWMNKLVGVHLELAQRTKEIYPYVQKYIEIASAYNYKILDDVSQRNYEVVQEELSLADDESEYQKSSEEIEQEKRAEQERQMEEERRIRERAENFINNNQSAYGDQSYEQRYFDYDAYMRGETHSVYSEDTRK